MRLLILFILLSFSVTAQTIPASLRVNWHNAGIEGAFVEPSITLDIANYGAVPNDNLSDDAALVSAINAANGNAAVIQFPAGNYNFSSPISLPDSIVLKGNGSDSTLFTFNLNNAQLNCINFWGSGSQAFQAVYGGLSNGSGYVLVDGADTMYAVNDFIEIAQLNGSWNTNPAFWAEYSVGHLSRVSGLSGDTIFLTDPLRIDFSISLLPVIHKIDPIVNSGIECLKIQRLDSLAPGINYGVYFYFAWNCRVKGIESYKSIGAHIIAESSAHLVILDSYFHEAYTYDGNNTRGYGVIMGVHTCASRIENNIFRQLRHSMMVKQGANGNVFGYNYSRETIRSEFPSNASGDISVHGHYPFANLFEGNIVQNLAIDQSWGPAGPRNTYFRNRVELYGLIISSGTVQSDTQVVVGNTIPSTAPFTGLYVFAGTGHFTYGNRVQGNLQPAGTSALTDSSYYLQGVPAFWPNSIAFPPIGQGGTGAETNPAKQRYLSGSGFVVCDGSITSGILENENSLSHIEFLSHTLTVKMLNGEKIDFLRVVDVNGRSVFESRPAVSTVTYTLPILSQGIYLVDGFSGKNRINSRILVK